MEVTVPGAWRGRLGISRYWRDMTPSRAGMRQPPVVVVQETAAEVLSEFRSLDAEDRDRVPLAFQRVIRAQSAPCRESRNRHRECSGGAIHEHAPRRALVQNCHAAIKTAGRRRGTVACNILGDSSTLPFAQQDGARRMHNQGSMECGRRQTDI